MIEVANSGRRRFVEWPAEKKAIDIGSFYADSTRFRTMTGWEPQVMLREGLTRTIAFYREHLARYL
jgi:UDP-glucose 4-epimerase